MCVTFASIADQTFRLRLLQIRRSNFAFIWLICSDFICITFASTTTRRSDFIFCKSGVQTSPSYGSDVQTSSSAYQAFRLRLHMSLMFKLRLLHIGHSDFAFIWIRCSYFINITCASTVVETFRLRLLQIKHLDFAFIWIRCLDFICITFPSTVARHSDSFFCISGVQTSPSYGSDVQTSSASHVLAS